MVLMQAIHTISELPESALSAAEAYFADHHATIRAMLEDSETTSLVVLLPLAPTDHDDWRRTLARDLARAYAPKRANVVGASAPDAASKTLAYLRDAPGVTGQYLACHE